MTTQPRLEAKLRKDALAIFKAALAAVEPGLVVSQAVSRSGETLKIALDKKKAKTIDLGKIVRIFVVGAGKATAPMAQALEKVLGARISGGVISVKKGHGLPLKRVEVLEAAHPVPDKAGVKAARAIKAVLEEAGQDDLVFSLISGGGSALLPLPAEGLKLTEKQSVTKLLLACGANIHEINAVRKHLSQVKGGQMARLAAPATVINLMLSDVVGDNMDTIASGPFVPDRSSFEEVAVILAKYRLMKKVPAAVRNHLIKKGLTGQIPDTPKADDPAFARVTNLIVGSNQMSLKSAEAKAKALGYRPLILSSSMEGETREVARVHVAIGREVKYSGHPLKAPACLISGGETTVTLRGKGKGGRNQEFALAAALEIENMENVVVFSAGTDGTDGPTDAAGAMADWHHLPTGDGQTRPESPHQHLLENNDSYPLLRKPSKTWS